MIQKMIIVAGNSAVGKTALGRHLISYFAQQKQTPCVCKIDCLSTTDHHLYHQLNVPSVSGLSHDICPDHFLISNMMELLSWGESLACNLLLIETAGLCHRCSPATEKTLNICVVDCTASCKSPEKLGPMLSKADFIALTKIDLISQAEKEIIYHNIQCLNQHALIFPIDGISGYGIELLGQHLLAQPIISTFENDCLRHSMPSGVCSYCIGEQRIGSAFQQGVVEKINFGGALLC